MVPILGQNYSQLFSDSEPFRAPCMCQIEIKKERKKERKKSSEVEISEKVSINIQEKLFVMIKAKMWIELNGPLTAFGCYPQNGYRNLGDKIACLSQDMTWHRSTYVVWLCYSALYSILLTCWITYSGKLSTYYWQIELLAYSKKAERRIIICKSM